MQVQFLLGAPKYYLFPMFADVVLHRRVPSRFESFTYSLKPGARAQPGQLVRVPFRNQTLSAIVRRLHDEKPAYAVRPVAEVLPVRLTQQQLALAEWMSRTYTCPFSKTVDFFVPEKVWKGGLAQGDLGAAVQSPAPSGPKFSAAPIIQKILCRDGGAEAKNFLLFETAPLKRANFYAALAAALPQSSQALFLFPEIFSLRQFCGKFPIYHGELKEGEKAEIWQSVAQGAIRILFGTRAALFLPFKNLSLVTLDFEENENYREIRKPEYHALDVAEKLTSLWSARLTAISSCPRVETLYRIHQGELERIALTPPKSLSAPRVRIISMADERRKGVTGPFSEYVIEKTAAAMSQGKQVLFFLNRKGQASALLCSDCHEVLRCEACTSSLTLHRGNMLRCHRCRTERAVPAQCPRCLGLKLKPLGEGTQKLETEIQKIFGRARVVRLDSDTIKKKKVSAPQRVFPVNDADIIIATQIIEKPLRMPRLTLAAALAPDFLFHLPNFRAEERAFQLFTHLKNLLAKNGELVIQTWLPEHLLLRDLETDRPESFYARELETRKSLSLPPFATRSLPQPLE